MARDGWKDDDRERAERAIELTGHRERMAGMLQEIVKGPADSPLKRYVTLVALALQALGREGLPIARKICLADVDFR